MGNSSISNPNDYDVDNTLEQNYNYVLIVAFTKRERVFCTPLEIETIDRIASIYGVKSGFQLSVDAAERVYTIFQTLRECFSSEAAFKAAIFTEECFAILNPANVEKGETLLKDKLPVWNADRSIKVLINKHNPLEEDAKLKALVKESLQ